MLVWKFHTNGFDRSFFSILRRAKIEKVVRASIFKKKVSDRCTNNGVPRPFQRSFVHARKRRYGKISKIN